MDRFYREVLGLSPRSRRPGFVNFDWGATRLTVAVHDMVEGSARDPLRIMVNLGVDDIHDAHARLHEQGVEFVRQPERESWGGWVATLYDPDGNIVQLLQLRPG
jgi:predicted enzyme related to lactoylglutathione lyase